MTIDTILAEHAGPSVVSWIPTELGACCWQENEALLYLDLIEHAH